MAASGLTGGDKEGGRGREWWQNRGGGGGRGSGSG